MSDTSDEISVAQARKMMLWLCFECPLGGNPDHCHVSAIRQVPFPERRRWVSGLSDEECLRLYDCHLRCEAAKEAARREAARKS